MKYAEWIRVLDNESIYAASSVVRNGEGLGLFEKEEFENENRTKVRNSLNRFAGNHFKGEPDGQAPKEGNRTLNGWYGWRWKAGLPAYFFEEQELLEIRKCSARYGEPITDPLYPAKRKRPIWRARFPRILSARKRPILFMALFVAAFSLGTLMTVYSEGLRVLNEEGPRAALEYFRSSAFKRQDYKAQFGQAWAKYEIGHFAEAENDCHRLLGTHDLPDTIAGNCYYLLGYIRMRTDRFDEAREYFQIAADLYERNRKWQHLYQTSLVLGEIAMEQGFLDEAEITFHEAFTANRPIDRNLGHYFHLQAKLAFHREDHERALQLARKSYFEFEKVGRFNDQVDMLCEIGFFLMLVGEYRQGYEKTMEAQELILKIGDQRKYYFNLINLILFNKCRNEPLSPLLQQVEKRVEEEGPGQLETHLDFVLAWACVPEKDSIDDNGPTTPELGGEGTDPPPPDFQ